MRCAIPRRIQVQAPSYVKVFDKFGQDKYKVSTMNANNFNEDMQKLFIAFFTLVDPQNIYKGRVDFIQKWYKAVPGRATQLLNLYGSNSIIYKIKEETLQEATWYRLLDCINKITINEFQLGYLFDTIQSEIFLSSIYVHSMPLDIVQEDTLIVGTKIIL